MKNSAEWTEVFTFPSRAFNLPLVGVPILLLLVAILCAAVAAYGTDSSWGSVNHGLQLIYASKRYEWVLLAISIIACLVLVGLVISGKRRSWWLLGLAPVLTLFIHQLTTNQMENFRVADNPTTMPADAANFLRDDDYVVGITLEQDAYAFPYRQLFATPVVLQDSAGKRVMILWSAYANRAIAYSVDHEYRGRDLEIVAMPANALLVYNSRYGQFINGVTGMTSRGELPTGVRRQLPTTKTTWKNWSAEYPDTVVMAPTVSDFSKLPSGPLLPHYKVPAATQPSDYRITLVVRPPTTQPSTQATTQATTRATTQATTRPLSHLSARVFALPADVPPRPVNLHGIIILRDPANNFVHAYSTLVNGKSMGKFSPLADGRRPQVFMYDHLTRSGWSTGGIAMDGTNRGQKLTPIPVDTDLYFNVMKFWMPEMELTEFPKEAEIVPPAPTPVPESRIRGSSRSRSSRSSRSKNRSR